ncbi:sulfurtransferase [Defluviimonas sp. WL0002]|uniref:Sulfurtransferase n=1 Tax=Albidovulum marisflavi TaxID=2984159 RepID=A0ABT2ZC71_9RHOB|nr:sulfurtransferase [Defluviimonas sp. WL0002]MCV2868701.1 sulfurtransferase [Defluviimonas sp. WL0002]
MSKQPSPLATTSWLASHLDDADLCIIDACWKFRDEQGQAVAYDDDEDFIREHIPGAVYVGMVSDLSDPDNPVPDMIAKPEAFAKIMSRLGVTNDSHVIVYDGSGLPLAAARLWWALSYYGHDRVQVLDGGLQQWKLENRPLASGYTQPKFTDFQVNVRPEWIAQKSDVIASLDDPAVDLVDCLPTNLFRGDGKHTWGGRSGHIPGAINIPAISNMDPALALTSYEERARRLSERGSFRFADQHVLLAHYLSKGLSTDREVIAYCGRGLAASCGLLALRSLGFNNCRLYDGSWAEWSEDEELPIETS